MKNFLHTAKNWIIFGVFASVIIIVSLTIFLKARQATNPNIADDGQWLYATAGTTLTAGKWNTLVSNSKNNYQKVSLTNGDYQTPSASPSTCVPWADITMTTSANPVLIMISLATINNWTSASTIYCDIAIDGTKLSSWSPSFRTSLAAWTTETLNYNYITNTLTAGSHNFKVYCWSDWWRILIKKSATLQTQFNVIELKQ